MRFFTKFIFTSFLALSTYLFISTILVAYMCNDDDKSKINSNHSLINQADYSVYDVASWFHFNATDRNVMKFEEIIEQHCNARLINVSRECLHMLQKYNVLDLNVDFKLRTEKRLSGDDDDDKLLYHTFWLPNVEKKHHLRVMNLNILSYLATQDLKRTKYIVWSMEYLNVFKDLHGRFKKYVEDGVLDFRVMNFKELCSAGLFKLRYGMCVFDTAHGFDIIHFSDFARFLILYSYGGIYVDGDVIFLRDMKPFWFKNFVYRWSASKTINTAVMGMRRGHGAQVENLFMESILETTSPNYMIQTFYPSTFAKIMTRVASREKGDMFSCGDFKVYSSALFDPAWLCFDAGDSADVPNMVCRFDHFYDLNVTEEEFKQNGGRFFPGAFTYHLHLGTCGTCKVRKDSYFHHVETYFKSKLR